ncbi:MAG: FHA domain-containing protein [Ilumatobacteraceae bacterium]
MVTIGRDSGSSIRLDDERVSRRHAELRPGPDGWLLVDLGSTSGTFLGGERVQEVLLRTTTTVRFGGANSPNDVSFEPVTTAAPAGWSAPGSGGPTELAAPVLLDPTVMPGGVPARPGGVLAPNAAAGATEVAGDTLNVQFGSATRTLHPGDVVVVGRGSPDLSTENPTVSRSHVRISHQGDAWYVEDLGSSRGTFLDGRKVTREPVKGSMAFWLGPTDAGERLVVVGAGQSGSSVKAKLRSPRITSYVAIAAVVLAVAALVTVLVVRSGSDSDQPVSSSQLRAATVFIQAGDYTGSGTIIDGERGLILTNAHVVRPDAPGQGVLWNETIDQLPESPRDVVISLSKDADEPAEPTYVARVVAFDGYLDLAVLEIVETIGGSVIGDDDDLDLPSVPIGDSDELDQDSKLIIFGYPIGVAGSKSSTRTDGSVAGFAPDARIRGNRAWINTAADIASGNSGGLAADEDGNLVGVPTGERSIDIDAISQIRPVNLASDLIAAAREGEQYESPYITEADKEEISNVRFATPGNAFSTTCRNREAERVMALDSLSLMFDFEKFPEGHQDLLVVVTDSENRQLGFLTSDQDWPVEWGTEGCAAVTVPLQFDLVPGETVVATFLVGPNYELTAAAVDVPV